ncbi:DUF6646 family protein [Mariniflexile gromovii]|uniref:Outer membrane protein with beta-barrel domain n=1 Tax=Mariniflexile gromovii TaxID=362523 RepID=A0ABS4BYV3_9FLAO|nr:DUF6646 family protein [Mariniflexile gromovii]MBP0905768.1 hypothetical protein [Mariniflexile gromovii]
MRKLIFLVTIFSVALGNSQAFTGTNDNKLQLGTNLQDNATGINISFDYGLGENISVGVSSSYALGLANDISASFGDRFDAKVRFNANLGNVINVDDNFDVYPGLNLSLKNFGGHLGARYFFSDGFGVYTEFNVPLAKYNTDILDAGEKLHNQFTVNLGACFNL